MSQGLTGGKTSTAEPEVRSPCVGICALDEQDICVGCGRSRLELGQWSKASDEQKLAQLERAKVRMAAMLKPK